MKIGNVILREQPLFLAPMDDVTDSVFRRICKSFGADVTYTEFVSSDGLIRNAAKTIQKLSFTDEERPIGIQIYGNDKDAMVEAALIAQEANPDIIDINYGCPVKKIALRGAGSGMLNQVPLMIEITAAIVKAVHIPVTVKTRLGYDQKTKNIVEIAERLQDTGIQAITIHGRTRDQLYTGQADWTLIAEVKNNPRMKIPIIGNGDITSPEKAKEAFERYNVDGIMIGRGSIGQPYLFKQIRHYLSTGEILPPHKVSEIIPVIQNHLNLLLEGKPEKSAILHLRRHFAQYFKGLPNFRNTRIKLLTAETKEAVLETLSYIENVYGDMPCTLNEGEQI
jgi:nifR3 family TIM-barrel protein